MSERFFNPYTFVPLPEDGAARSDPSENNQPVFSGEIRCTLVTKTQLAVPDILKNPCSSEEKRTEPKEYDFFSVTTDGQKTAAIPGSGIRGVIRSVFETLTDSCMRLNDTDRDYFHTRLNKTEAGIIEFDGKNYALYAAERLRDKENRGYKNNGYFTGKKIENISAVSGKGSTRIVGWDKGSQSGVYLRVNQFGSGNKASHPSVFLKKSRLEENLKKEYVDRLEVNIKMYEGKYKTDYDKAFNNMKERGGQLPVWYWRDPQTGHYYFAPSQYSRAVFFNRPKDFVKNARIERCSSGDNVCEACALFGFIGNDSRASRVRFTDALCQTPDPFDGSYILPILSTPRLSSFEFYLDGNGSPEYGADTAGVKLRGRKFYWHDPNAKITCDDSSAKAQPKMASKMQLVKSGCEFRFSVFFDKITDDQLKKLVFALNLGSNDSQRCHKLGHGKPVGLGSVKIAVDSVVKRGFENGVYSVNDVTEQIVPEAKDKLFRQSRELQAFLQRVLYFKTVGNNTVDYPRVVPKGNAGDDIFKWFAGNRGSLRSKGYIKVEQLLPKITDQQNDQMLERQSSNSKPQGGRPGQGNYNKGYNKHGGHR